MVGKPPPLTTSSNNSFASANKLRFTPYWVLACIFETAKSKIQGGILVNSLAVIFINIKNNC
ncbi:hypothetical protein PLEI_0293 [Photobacterium leiognathi lrivu.4.1]|uniref:Uncharacterized protein n=1 Tax=Photobacterium leiognathi lrivu.4.1 TaxID=1248232 RepID=V5H1P4_PHOLE|nr:hypothetical protein PLEI_0293 [Photobacterium leiognathi lrivu.4.1]